MKFNMLSHHYGQCLGNTPTIAPQCLYYLPPLFLLLTANTTAVKDHFIGCFTNLSWSDGDLSFVKARLTAASDQDCIAKCRDANAPYAVTQVYKIILYILCTW